MRTRLMVGVTAALAVGLVGAGAAPTTAGTRAGGSHADGSHPGGTRAGGAAVRPYRTVILGTLGGAQSRATAINEAGQVVGVSDTAHGDSHAFLWSGGRLTDLGTLGGANSAAADINAAGQVVGVSDTRSGDSHAFLWSRGRMTDLGALGREDSAATAINDTGTIVGTVFGPNPTADNRAFLWRAGRMTLLAGLPGSGVPGSGFREGLLASDINAAGDVVGLGKDRGAVVRWHRGVPTVLFETSTFVGINAPRINGPGDVVAYWSPSHIATVLFWRAGSTERVVGPLGDGVYAGDTAGINDGGQFVGGYVDTTDFGRRRPYVSRGDSSLTDLSTRGIAADAMLVDINNRGQIAGAVSVGSTVHPALFLP